MTDRQTRGEHNLSPDSEGRSHNSKYKVLKKACHLSVLYLRGVLTERLYRSHVKAVSNGSDALLNDTTTSSPSPQGEMSMN